MLIWFWVAGMNLLQRPGDTMNLIMVATVVGTAIVASMEAGKVRMESDRRKGTYSPTSWFFLITLLWIVGYPAYLLKRRHYGLKNRIVAGVMVALLFMGSWSVMAAAIDSQITKVQQQFKSIGK
jgi:hypothetical protein